MVGTNYYLNIITSLYLVLIQVIKYEIKKLGIIKK